MEEPRKKPLSPWVAYAYAGEIAYLIAIPAVLFGVGGAWLDKALRTAPVLMILGLSLAFTVSSISIARVIRKLQKQAEEQAKP